MNHPQLLESLMYLQHASRQLQEAADNLQGLAAILQAITPTSTSEEISGAGQESTPTKTPESPPQHMTARLETDHGPVELCSECARKLLALMLSSKTPAQDATGINSIFHEMESESSADIRVGGYIHSPLRSSHSIGEEFFKKWFGVDVH